MLKYYIMCLVKSKAHDIHTEQPLTFWSNETEEGTYVTVSVNE